MKDFYKNLFLLFVTLLMLFAVFEVAFRIIIPQNQTEYNSEYGMVITPNLDYTMRASEYTTHYTSNSQGFRDKERSVEKEYSTYRIAIIGDSFTEAIQVDIKDRFDSLLEQKLEERTGRDVEILNFGVGGYGTDQEYLVYKNIVREYNPDLVILMFVYNDFQDNAVQVNKPYHTIDSEGDLVLNPAKFNYNPLLRKALANSRFLTFVANSAYKLIRAGEEPAVPYALQINLPESKQPESVRNSISLTFKILEKFNNEVKRDGSKFLIVSVPPVAAVEEESIDKFKDTYPAFNWGEVDFFNQDKIIINFALGRNIDFLVLYEKMKNSSANSNLYFLQDEHWNEEGHNVVAEIMSDKIYNSYLI